MGYFNNTGGSCWKSYITPIASITLDVLGPHGANVFIKEWGRNVEM